MNNVIISNNMIELLREEIKTTMSKARFEHTLGVEHAAVKIGTILEYQDISALRAAALLHDISKEYSFEKQLKICDKFGIMLRDDEKSCPQILHAITATAIISQDYSKFASCDVVSAVRWHTTGRKNMTLAEKIICLADYIEDGRKHDSCVQLRKDFWDNFLSCQSYADKLACLNKALKALLENTVLHLESKRQAINTDTLEALEYIKDHI